jgi:hypothetical protein
MEKEKEKEKRKSGTEQFSTLSRVAVWQLEPSWSSLKAATGSRGTFFWQRVVTTVHLYTGHMGMPPGPGCTMYHCTRKSSCQ